MWISRRRAKLDRVNETGSTLVSNDLAEDDSSYLNPIAFYALIFAIAAISLFGFYTILVFLEKGM